MNKICCFLLLNTINANEKNNIDQKNIAENILLFKNLKNQKINSTIYYLKNTSNEIFLKKILTRYTYFVKDLENIKNNSKNNDFSKIISIILSSSNKAYINLQNLYFLIKENKNLKYNNIFLKIMLFSMFYIIFDMINNLNKFNSNQKELNSLKNDLLAILNLVIFFGIICFVYGENLEYILNQLQNLLIMLSSNDWNISSNKSYLNTNFSFNTNKKNTLKI